MAVCKAPDIFSPLKAVIYPVLCNRRVYEGLKISCWAALHIRILQTMVSGITLVLLSWALGPLCRILVFMWSLGPLQMPVLAGPR